MKILLLTTHLDIGGVAVYTVNLAGYLKRKGVDVSVASSGGQMEKDLAANGIRHIKIDIRTKSEFGPKAALAIPVLIREIKKNGFQLVHAQTRVAQIIACAASWLTKTPFVSTCHGFFRYKKVFRRLFPCWGAKIIAISNGVKEHLMDDFGIEESRVEMIYNGIEVEKYLSRRNDKDLDFMRKMGIDENAVIIGSVGRLSSVKGYKYLIDAFARVIEKYPQSCLLLVGEGKEEKTLRRQISESGLSGKVIMGVGELTLTGYLSLMDIFCLPSISEGLGLSLMEAMAGGKACIASDVPGLSELIIDGKDGFLVPPVDAVRLASGIMRFIEDPGMRESMGRKAREKAIAGFSLDKSVDKTIKVYREVVEGESSEDTLPVGV
ncbi:MAG: glycosyltransferase family 4 protein [Candidatus Omnitrophota bacterium]|nr:glycosyltransferase family 4 protein [Candidatus Omnitrophota bacterium]